MIDEEIFLSSCLYVLHIRFRKYFSFQTDVNSLQRPGKAMEYCFHIRDSNVVTNTNIQEASKKTKTIKRPCHHSSIYFSFYIDAQFSEFCLCHFYYNGLFLFKTNKLHNISTQDKLQTQLFSTC